MSTIRIQALPKFPASVEAGDGILIEHSNGIFTFSVDPDVLTGLLGDPVEVAHGGTGVATLTDHGVLVGSGVDAITPLAVGVTNSILQGVTGADPVFTTTPQVSSISVGNSGTPTAPITLNTPSYEFFLNKSGTITGTLLQMQAGKAPSNVLEPTSAGLSVIELNVNFDSGTFVDNDARYSVAQTLVNNMVAGEGGASLGMFIAARATGDWTPNAAFLGGCTAAIFLAESDAGMADIFGFNAFARATTNPAKSINGIEIDTDNQVNGTLMKQALQIADLATSVGSCVDSVGINFIAQAGAFGYLDGIRFSPVAGAFPIQSNGTLMKASSGTIGSGLDISAMGYTTGHAVLMPNATYLTGLNFAGNAHLKLIGADASNFVTLYNGIAKLAPTGSLTLGAAGAGTGSLALAGMTSGAVTLKAQATAGAADITLGTTTGTVAASATPPLAINATTGVVSISGSALTKTDDTNVTLTLGGTPTSALLVGTSLTLGWTGTLSVVRGGTGISAFGTGVATALGVNVGTAGAFVVNGGALGSPSSVGTLPAHTISGAITYGGVTLSNSVTGTGSMVLQTAPSLVSTGTGAGAVTVSGSAVSMLNVTGGSGSGQGAQLAMTRGAVQHNFGHAAAILGGTSDDFLIYGSGANNVKLYANGVLGLTVEPTGRIAFNASSTSRAPISMPAGTAPTSPVDGDFWYDGTNLKFRNGGTTRTVTWV